MPLSVTYTRFPNDERKWAIRVVNDAAKNLKAGQWIVVTNALGAPSVERLGKLIYEDGQYAIFEIAPLGASAGPVARAQRPAEPSEPPSPDAHGLPASPGTDPEQAEIIAARVREIAQRLRRGK